MKKALVMTAAVLVAAVPVNLAWQTWTARQERGAERELAAKMARSYDEAFAAAVKERAEERLAAEGKADAEREAARARGEERKNLAREIARELAAENQKQRERDAVVRRQQALDLELEIAREQLRRAKEREKPAGPVPFEWPDGVPPASR